MNARVVHVSDLHIESVPERRFPGLMGRLEQDKVLLQRLRPDLVVATGDLTNWGSSRREDLELAREWLDGLGLPVLAVPGNHDLGSAPHRAVQNPESEAFHDGPFATSPYAEIFGADPVVRADLDGLTVFGVALREDDPDGVVDSLARSLADVAGPVIVAGHFPLVPTREVSFSREFGSDDYVPRAAERLRALLAATPNVAAYLCGHVHIVSRRPISATCEQFTAGGLGSGASLVRVFDVDGSRMTFDTLEAAGPQTFWEAEFEEARADPFFSAGHPHERSGELRLSGVRT